MGNPKAVAIVSGGMDSVTLAHLLHDQQYDLHLVSFDYGQRHSKELEYAKRCAERLGAKHSVIELTQYGKLLTGSALTDSSVEVPDGHYADANMRVTVVPNRNLSMLSLAAGIAVAEGAELIATAVHSGDHAIYPDCRSEFIAAANTTLQLANEGFTVPGFKLDAPFVNIDKTGIAITGSNLITPVPWDETWSCYKGGDIHCGTCGTCVERKEALHLAGVEDPTQYVA